MLAVRKMAGSKEKLKELLSGDIVTLLAMPSRPQPRKVPRRLKRRFIEEEVFLRTVEAVPSLFQVRISAELCADG